jgi:Ca2+-binding EF-hand superfamily protein
MEIPVSDAQIIALFELIDVNKDGFIDRADWMKVVPIQSNLQK